MRLLQSEGGRAGATAPPPRRAPASPSFPPSVAGQALPFSSPEPVPPPVPIGNQPLARRGSTECHAPAGTAGKAFKNDGGTNTPHPHTPTGTHTEHTPRTPHTSTRAHLHTCMLTGTVLCRALRQQAENIL